MSRIYVGLAALLIILSMLASCNQHMSEIEEPVEKAQSKIGSVSGLQSDSPSNNELGFDDQGVALSAYTNLLAYFDWDYDVKSIDKMPFDYGGCYINDKNVLTVCVVSPNEENTAVYKEACREPIKIKEVSYTLKELYQAADAVLKFNAEGKLEVYSVGADELNNCVPITMPDEESADAARQLLADYPCVLISAADNSLTLSQYGETQSDNDVTIVPEYPVYDPGVKGIQFAIYNNGDKNLMFGAGDYTVEVDLNGQWYSIPFKPDISFAAIGYALPPKTHRYRGVGLFILNYKFTAGRYRVVQKFEDHIYFSGFELGESKITVDTPYGFLALEDLPKDYTIEDATADGCIIAGDENTYGSIASFLDKASWGVQSKIRIASKTLLGNVVLTDVECKHVDNGATALFYTHDNSRDSLNFNRGITSSIYSWLNYLEKNDEFSIILSNYSSAQYLGKDDITQSIIKIRNRDVITDVKALMEKIEERYTTASSKIYVIYTPSGKYSAGLSNDPMKFSIHAPGHGQVFHITEDQADEITDIKWLSEGRLQLIGTVDGKRNREIGIFNADLRDFE